jgi:hypothetical protein
VHHFLEHEVLPSVEDHRLRFRTLVAMNALTIVERESPPHEKPDPARVALARRLRAGDLRDDDLGALSQDVEARLRVASPRFLERVGRA